MTTGRISVSYNLTQGSTISFLCPSSPSFLAGTVPTVVEPLHRATTPTTYNQQSFKHRQGHPIIYGHPVSHLNAYGVPTQRFFVRPFLGQQTLVLVERVQLDLSHRMLLTDHRVLAVHSSDLVLCRPDFTIIALCVDAVLVDPCCRLAFDLSDFEIVEIYTLI